MVSIYTKTTYLMCLSVGEEHLLRAGAFEGRQRRRSKCVLQLTDRQMETDRQKKKKVKGRARY
jgi:hypothetical protein